MQLKLTTPTPFFSHYLVNPTKNNSPLLCEWAIGTGVIDLISPNGEFILNQVFVKNAHRQPNQFQISFLKNSLKSLYLDIYKNADQKQICETCPFNIYSRIIFKTKSVCSHYYSLLNCKANKTLLWEKARISLERDW